MALKKHVPFKSNLIPDDLSSLYASDDAYGRTKLKNYYSTGAGKAHANAQHDEYNQWLMGEAGAFGGQNPLIGSGTAFESFANDYFANDVEQGYAAANGQAGGHLNYNKYLDTLGFGGKDGYQHALTERSDNPFTSASLPDASGIDRMRAAYFALTPQQRAARGVGGANPATVNRPGRWSIF